MTRTSLEIERKYDVTDRTAVPDWNRLPFVASIGAPERRDLDARYLDTPDGSLARAGVAVRRRTGGPDAGWHIKRTVPEGKLESQWPLADAADSGSVPAPRDAGEFDVPVPPEAVVAALADIAAPPYVVRARIRTTRIAVALRDASGGMVAEFVDDRVEATDVSRAVTTRWREWELELGPAGPATARGRDAVFAAADALVIEAGGSPASTDSKLARTLTA